MKLLFVTEQLPYGYNEAFLTPELREFLRSGQELVVVPLVSSNAPPDNDARFLHRYVRTARLTNPRVVARVALEVLRQPRRSAWLLWRALRSGRMALKVLNVHATLLALALRRQLASEGVQHVHSYWANVTATMAQAFAELLQVSWSFTAHRYDIVADNGLAEKLRDAAFARFISESGIVLARRTVRGPVSGDAFVLPLGIEIPMAVTERNDEGSVPVILCPARLVAVKGHTYLLRACALLRDRGVPFSLWVAGDGVLRETLEMEVHRLAISDSVRFLGRRSHDEVLEWYRRGAVHCVVLPSLDLGHGVHEGVPISLVEAMAHAIPVVSTATGGIPELVTPDVGLLVPAGDATALADAIATVVVDRVRAKRFGEAARERVHRRHDATVAVRALLGRIDPMITGKSGEMKYSQRGRVSV